MEGFHPIFAIDCMGEKKFKNFLFYFIFLKKQPSKTKKGGHLATFG